MSNMVVNTNVLALNSHRAMKNVGATQTKASARLSSGLRVNSAADDAAGLAISEKMRAQIRGLDMSSKNAQDATSLIQTAEGGMQEVDNMLQRIRELVVQVSNDTNEQNSMGTGDRQKIQDEINQLVEEIDSMGERVEYNKKKIINGTYADPVEMLSTASNKYAEVSKNLESSLIQLQTSQVLQTRANNDYSNVNKIVDAFEAELGAREKNLTDAMDSLKEFSNAFASSNATFNSAAFNQQAFDAAMKGFVNELISLNPDKWTDASLDALAKKYFVGDADGSKAGYKIASAASSAAVENTSVQSDILMNSAAPAITITMSGVQASGGATISMNITNLTADGAGASATNPSLGGLIIAAYEAYQKVQYWDSAGGQASQEIYASAVASGAAFGGAKITATNGGGISATLPGVGTKDSFYEHTANKLSENTNFKSSADMYQALANVSETKVNADTEVSKLESDVKTYEKLVDTYNTQIKSANDLMSSLNGKSAGLYFQVGANSHQSLQTSIGSVKSDILGVGDGNGNSSINVLKDTGSDITSTLNILDEALSYVTTQRSKLGAAQNRLEYTVKSLDVSSENLSAAESRIRDADMAKEMMNVTKANVLQQAAVSMLAQANQAPQTVLQLLR